MYLGIRAWRRVGSGICKVGGVGSGFQPRSLDLVSAVRTISKTCGIDPQKLTLACICNAKSRIRVCGGRCVSYVSKNCIFICTPNTFVSSSYQSLFLHINTAEFSFYLAFYSYTFSWDRAHIYIRHFTIPYCLHIVHEQQYPIVKEWHLMICLN